MEGFKFSTIEEAVADLRAGKMIIAVDDPDRENEGDLICAAEHATLENVNFMASYAKGLICMPMSKALTTKLGLEQMVANNTDNHCTAFTVSIDHVDTTTGISALERSMTAMKSVKDDAKPSDFRRPGHMFPLEAKAGGVLERMGHTEAAPYDFSNQLRNFQWGVQLGADWEAFKHLKLYADLSWGLNDAFKKDFNTITFSMYPIYLNAGIAYLF